MDLTFLLLLNFSEKIFTGWNKYWYQLLRIPVVHRKLAGFYEKKYPGILGYMFCRFRYYDDIIKNCLKNNEIEVIVNIGAGMDCRPYYIDKINCIQYYEIDHPKVIEKKKKTIKKVLGYLPEFVHYMGVDLNGPNVEDILYNLKFPIFSKTLFICESVSPYLTKRANDTVLRFISRAAKGSRLVYSYMTSKFIAGKNIDHKTLKKLHQRIIVNRELEINHGYDQHGIEIYLQQFSMLVKEHIGSRELYQRYIEPSLLDIEVVEVERFVFAELK